MASSSTTPSSSSLGSSRSSFAASSSSSLAGSPSPSSNSGSQPPCTSPQGCPTGAPPPATLYLYTFLSTLIILLLVSGGIIARSVVLRRRQQIAIANGTWIPPQRRENYSNRPRPLMFDAYLAMSAHGSKAKNDDEERWSCMKPFSASDISSPVKPIVVLPPVESVHDLHAPIRRAARAQMRSLMRLHSPFHPPRAPPPPAPPPIELAPQPTTIPSPTEKVRVALLVAMPWQEVPPQDEEDDEEFLPHLEFGVFDADVVDLGKLSGDEGERERANSGTKS